MVKTRYLEEPIREDLRGKMVMIGGPRQVGKTTLSRDIIAGKGFSSFRYYTWDSKEDRKAILDEALSDSDIIILDEIHKYEKWKPLVKGIYDKKLKNQQIIVTGSARLNVYRRGGDSLQGRYHYYRLHPFSAMELENRSPHIEPMKPLSFSGEIPQKQLDSLLTYGGFPEPILNQSPKQLRRWHNDRIERMVKEDIRDISSINDIGNIQLLVDMLPSKVASLLSINTIREDLEVSHRSISHWIATLEELYYAYRIYPYQNNRIRALKKEPKLFLWDWSEVVDPGARFENMVAGHLLKTVHYLRDTEGFKTELFYLRDKEKREVDFLVTVDNTPWF
ncbi:MAG: ATP-binding protein, partial [Candidatus Margulisbacteria bacterium]|nr:ATP-binding protein [Candidatus Margulisiibacteriota bacterium]